MVSSNFADWGSCTGKLVIIKGYQAKQYSSKRRCSQNLRLWLVEIFGFWKFDKIYKRVSCIHGTSVAL